MGISLERPKKWAEFSLDEASRRPPWMKRMFLIDALSTFVGVSALAASSLFRYMFGFFIVVTVCGFAFGARAGLLAVQKPVPRILIVLLSGFVWCGIASAGIIWWVSRYGE